VTKPTAWELLDKLVSDPLKAWLDEQEGPLGYNVRASISGKKALAALRAVVELHERDSSYSCGLCQTRSKCLTIRAIEKEVLK
jgi:hypothetical protein